MNVRILIGAALTALVSVLAPGPERIAERLSAAEATELSGRITAVEADAVRVQVEGEGEVLLRTDGQTVFAALELPPGVTPPELPCVERARPADEADLIVGELVTIMVEDEGGVMRALTITVVPLACGAEVQPRDGATGDGGGSGTIRGDGSENGARLDADAGLAVDVRAGNLVERIGSLLTGQ
jgi:hypothetical protein